MSERRVWARAGALLTAAAVVGCVAAPEPLSVVPGQSKTEATFRADDAACRGAPATVPTQSTPAASTPATEGGGYYQCMQSHGNLIVQTRTEAVPYPVYGGYPYAYGAYPYGYPYGYGYGYGYPYAAAYPFLGLGIGIGIGSGFYGGWRGGYGGWHGGYGGWHGGYGGWHGGGWRR